MGTESQPTQPELPKQKFVPYWTLLLAGVILLLILAGAIAVGVYWMRSEKLQNQRLADAVEAQKRRDELEQAKAGEAAKVALAQSRQQEVLAQIKTSTNTLMKLLESVARIDTQSTALKTNAAGRTVAQFPELVSQARRIYESEMSDLATKDDIIARLEASRRAQQHLVANLGTAYNPDGEMAAAAQNTTLWAEQSLQKSSAFEAYLANLVQDAKAKITDKPVTRASPTLADAIDQLNAAESSRRLQTIAYNTTAAKSNAAETVADAEAKRIVEDAKLEAARILREANLNAAKDSIENSKSAVTVQQIQNEAQKIKLREKAARPDIQSRLAAYLIPGHFLPTGQMDYDKKPMSYSQLREMGALDPSIKSLGAFLSIGVNQRNDRPRLSQAFRHPFWYNNPTLVDQGRELQQLMIELGPTWVEIGVMEK